VKPVAFPAVNMSITVSCDLTSYSLEDRILSCMKLVNQRERVITDGLRAIGSCYLNITIRTNQYARSTRYHSICSYSDTGKPDCVNLIIVCISFMQFPRTTQCSKVSSIFFFTDRSVGRGKNFCLLVGYN
jgi:hypothetical protein